MDSFINDPVMQTSLLPLLLSLVLAGVIGFSSRRGALVASLSVAISLLITTILIQGITFPPRAASQKLPYLVAAAGILGLLVDLRGLRGRALLLAALALPVAMLGWLFGARLSDFGITEWGYLAVLVAASGLAYWQCEQGRDKIDAGLKLLLVSGGLGAIALIGSSAMLAQTCFALMAAIGGLLLWNWPKFRFEIGAAAQFPLITALGALCAQSLFYTEASGVALLLLLPLLMIDRLLPVIPFLNRASTPAIRALSLGAVGAALLPLAIGSALLLTESSGYGY